MQRPPQKNAKAPRRRDEKEEDDEILEEASSPSEGEEGEPYLPDSKKGSTASSKKGALKIAVDDTDGGDPGEDDEDGEDGSPLASPIFFLHTILPFLDALVIGFRRDEFFPPLITSL